MRSGHARRSLAVAQDVVADDADVVGRRRSSVSVTVVPWAVTVGTGAVGGVQSGVVIVAGVGVGLVAVGVDGAHDVAQRGVLAPATGR